MAAVDYWCRGLEVWRGLEWGRLAGRARAGHLAVRPRDHAGTMRWSGGGLEPRQRLSRGAVTEGFVSWDCLVSGLEVIDKRGIQSSGVFVTLLTKTAHMTGVREER